MLALILALAISVMQPVKDKPHNIRVRVRPSADAVRVRVEVDDGENYYRSSEFDLDGHAEWVDFRDVPSGLFAVIATELSRDGKTHVSNLEHWIIP